MTEPIQLHRIFVYGTLKRGEPNHHWFSKIENATANYICDASTSERYPLIIATNYNIPFLLYTPGVGHRVRGELYEIDNPTLGKLDELEDHPNYYVRDQKTVIDRSSNKHYPNTWIYFLKHYKTELLEKPMMEEYSNMGPHGLKYFERYLREPDHDHVAAVLDPEKMKYPQ